jgi:hypothetical protein
MPFHPLLIVVLLWDVAALFCLLPLGRQALRALAGTPGPADHRRWPSQPATVARLAVAGTAFVTLAGAAFFLLLAIAWPHRVAGTMCGAGVVKAMAPWGAQALTLRGLALFVIVLWLSLARAAAGTSSLRPRQVLLVAIVPLVLAQYYSLRAVLALIGHQPKSCCSRLYESVVTAGATAEFFFAQPPAVWAVTALALAVASAAWIQRRRALTSRWPNRGVALMALALAPAALHSFAAQLTGAQGSEPASPCWWCLFQQPAWFAGYAVGLPLVALVWFAASLLGQSVAAGPPSQQPPLTVTALTRHSLGGLALAALTVGGTIVVSLLF